LEADFAAEEEQKYLSRFGRVSGCALVDVEGGRKQGRKMQKSSSDRSDDTSKNACPTLFSCCSFLEEVSRR